MSAFLFDGFRRFPLSPGANSLGRGARRNTVVLEDELVSGVHAWVLGMSDSSWVILDRNSTNGTWVNQRLVERQVLEPLDAVQVGNTRLVFHVEPEAGAPSSAAGTLVASATAQASRFLEVDRDLGTPLAGGPGAPAFDRLLALQGACRGMLGARGRDPLFLWAAARARDLLDADRSHLMRISEAGEVLERVAGAGWGQAAGPPHHAWVLAGEVVRADRALRWGDVLQVPGIGPGPRMHAVAMVDVGAALGAPVRARGELVAALLVDRRVQGAPFGVVDLTVLQHLARALGGAWPVEGEP